MNIKTALRVLNRHAALIYDYQPDMRSIIFLNGPWTFEIWPTMRPEAPLTVVDDDLISRDKIVDLHERCINADWYGEMGMRNEIYEWSLEKHGTN